MPDLGPQMKSLSALEPGVPYCPPLHNPPPNTHIHFPLPTQSELGSWVIAPPTAPCVSRPHPTRKTGQNTWTLHSLTTLEQADLMVCRAKPVALFCQGTQGTNHLKSRPQIALQALELLAPSGSWFIACPLLHRAPCPVWPGRLDLTPGKLCTPTVLKWGAWLIALSIRRAKKVVLLGQELRYSSAWVKTPNKEPWQP